MFQTWISASAFLIWSAARAKQLQEVSPDEITQFTIQAFFCLYQSGLPDSVFLCIFFLCFCIQTAEIDGANFWQRLRYVTLPMLSGAIMINLVFGITYGLKVFDIVYVLTNGGPGHATEVLTTYAFQLYSRGQYGMSSALNSILLLITAIAGVVIVKTLGKQEVQQ